MKQWSRKEINTLKRLAGKADRTVIARKTGRTVAAVQAKAYELKLSVLIKTKRKRPEGAATRIQKLWMIALGVSPHQKIV